MKLPEKTIERLSEYRRTLLNLQSTGKTHIYSHELAKIHHITAVQVRRDMMLMGYSSLSKKGYDVNELINIISEIIDTPEGLNVAVIGMGNLGRAITAYFNGKRPKLNIVASFDTDPNKVNRVISGVNCYHMNDLEDVVKREKISIGIITVPTEEAVYVSERLVIAGIKGILNFTSAILKVPPQIHLESYDMITSLEKVAYFVKKWYQK
jgi:redox-sensing transcriptional repressor